VSSACLLTSRLPKSLAGCGLWVLLSFSLWLLGVEALDVDDFGVAGEVAKLEEHFPHLRNLQLFLGAVLVCLVVGDMPIDTDRSGVTDSADVVALPPVIGFGKAVLLEDPADGAGCYCGALQFGESVHDL
jgi:hypothetical protein